MDHELGVANATNLKSALCQLHDLEEGFPTDRFHRSIAQAVESMQKKATIDHGESFHGAFLALHKLSSWGVAFPELLHFYSEARDHLASLLESTLDDLSNFPVDRLEDDTDDALSHFVRDLRVAGSASEETEALATDTKEKAVVVLVLWAGESVSLESTNLPMVAALAKCLETMRNLLEGSSICPKLLDVATSVVAQLEEMVVGMVRESCMEMKQANPPFSQQWRERFERLRLAVMLFDSMQGGRWREVRFTGYRQVDSTNAISRARIVVKVGTNALFDHSRPQS